MQSSLFCEAKCESPDEQRILPSLFPSKSSKDSSRSYDISTVPFVIIQRYLSLYISSKTFSMLYSILSSPDFTDFRTKSAVKESVTVNKHALSCYSFFYFIHFSTTDFAPSTLPPWIESPLVTFAPAHTFLISFSAPPNPLPSCVTNG